MSRIERCFGRSSRPSRVREPPPSSGQTPPSQTTTLGSFSPHTARYCGSMTSMVLLPLIPAMLAPQPQHEQLPPSPSPTCFSRELRLETRSSLTDIFATSDGLVLRRASLAINTARRGSSLLISTDCMRASEQKPQLRREHVLLSFGVLCGTSSARGAISGVQALPAEPRKSVRRR